MGGGDPAPGHMAEHEACGAKGIRLDFAALLVGVVGIAALAVASSGGRRYTFPGGT